MKLADKIKIYEEVKALNKAFWGHRSSAKQRGVPFNLTFAEWVDVWERSGKINERGHRVGQYVMSRHNDTGAYEVGNVFIQTHQRNSSANKGVKKGTPSTKTKNKISQATKGKRKHRGGVIVDGVVYSSMKEAAKGCGVHYNTISKWLNDGKIRAA